MSDTDKLHTVSRHISGWAGRVGITKISADEKDLEVKAIRDS